MPPKIHLVYSSDVRPAFWETSLSIVSLFFKIRRIVFCVSQQYYQCIVLVVQENPVIKHPADFVPSILMGACFFVAETLPAGWAASPPTKQMLYNLSGVLKS